MFVDSIDGDVFNMHMANPRGQALEDLRRIFSGTIEMPNIEIASQVFRPKLADKTLKLTTVFDEQEGLGLDEQANAEIFSNRNDLFETLTKKF